MKPIFYGIVVLGALIVWEAIKGLKGPVAAASSSTAPTPATSTLSPTAITPSGNLSLAEARVRDILQQAGFSGPGLERALTISRRESSWQSHPADNINQHTVVNGVDLGPSRDRGLFQFNSIVPPVQVTDECAYDPLCAAKAAFQATRGGTDWHAWSTDTP